MLIEFRLDRAGVREVLRGPDMRTLVDEVGRQVADHVRARLPAGVTVDAASYTTDRHACAVTIVDVRGMGWQARDGVLTHAAGAVGLEVKAWQQ